MAKSQAMVADKVRQEYGEESVEMLEALAEIMNKTALKELELHKLTWPLMMALPLINVVHSALPPPKCSAPLQDEPELFAQASHWVDYAAAAYGGKEKDEKDAIQQRLGDRATVLMACLPKAGVQCPGHFVAVDANEKVVVLGIRGTVNLSDAITDAVGNSVPFPEYPGVETHQAILAAAKEVLNRTRPTLNEALAANPGFGVVVTGHSLGAGTAVVCTLILQAEQLDGSPKLRGFAYAPPPIVSPLEDPAIAAVSRGPAASTSSSGCFLKCFKPASSNQAELYCFIHRHDVVPRISLHNSYMLGLEAKAVDATDLGFMERMALIRKGKTEAANEVAKGKVVEAVTREKEKAKTEPHKEFKSHFIPGRIFWISKEGSEPPKVSCSDAKEFQGLLLKGSLSALEDHRIGCYQVGLSSKDSQK
eukprot:TRINITY_DN16855_c0_g1_i2.p1 TRINITY_DN16855_c0_g1~~TRINITY_DN16855_c0_g1_i2.p1  ORF type:complete len:484 (+),score=114.20 TRINITY_DN16855_c0_g1_i2:192-1454(+)